MEKKMFLKAGPNVFEKARDLRSNPTHTELLLWGYLKQKPQGYKFIVDFYCYKLKLIIEVDGRVHENADVATYDKERQEHLESLGQKFLRFTNEEIEGKLDSAVKTIENYITILSQKIENHP